MKKRTPIINVKQLDVVFKKITELFMEEQLSPLEIKMVIDSIYNNLENLENIYSQANIIKTLAKNAEEAPIPGVS